MDHRDAKNGVTRQELYDLVWSEPMISVAKRFGISASYLARVCFSMSVPRPERGYWAKLQYGKAPKKPALPVLLSRQDVAWKAGSPIPNLTPVVRAVLPRTSIKQAALKTAESGVLHPILAEAAAAFKTSNRTREVGFLKPSKRNLPDILASEEMLPDALRLANSLYMALEARGHVVVLAPHSERISRPDIEVRDKPTKQSFYENLWSPARRTVAYIKGTPIGLVIFELTEATPVRYIGGKYIKETEVPTLRNRNLGHSWATTHEMPTGRLCLQAYTSLYDVHWTKQWKEAKSGKFNNSVASLLRAIESIVPEAQAERERGRIRAEEMRIRQEQAHIKWLEQERIRQRKEAVEKSTTALNSTLEQYESAMRLSRIFEHVESLALDLNGERRSEFENLLSAAKAMTSAAPTIELFLKWAPPAPEST